MQRSGPLEQSVPLGQSLLPNRHRTLCSLVEVLHESKHTCLTDTDKLGLFMVLFQDSIYPWAYGNNSAS